MITSPVIVKLIGKPEMGEGIMINVETSLEPLKDDSDQIIRDANGQVTLVKKREALVCWLDDRSQIFVHDLADLEWVEVVAVRTLDEMKEEVKEEVFNDIMDELNDEGLEDDSDRKSTRLNSSHIQKSRMPSSA